MQTRPRSCFREQHHRDSLPLRRKTATCQEEYYVCGKLSALRLDCRTWGPMHRRKSTSQRWSNQSLLRRLAALEAVSAAAAEVPPKRSDSSRKRRSAAFALGFTTAVLMGAIALAILSFVSLQSARADARPPMAQVAGLPHEAATDALTTGLAALSVDLWSGPRELWWGFPKAGR